MKHVGKALLAIGLVAVAARAAAAGGDPRLPFAAVRCGDPTSRPDTMVLPPASGLVPDGELGALEDAAAAAGLSTGKVVHATTGGTPDLGWCVAEKSVKVGKKTVTVTVSSVGGLTGEGSDVVDDRITFVARQVGNKQAAALLKAGKLARPAPIAGDADGEPIAQLRAALADRAKAAALWSTDESAVLAGSAPGEVYVGATARQTFATWNLGLRIDGPVLWSAVGHGELVWAVANVLATPAKGGPATTYRVFFVLLADHAEAYRGDDDPPAHDTWHLVVAHFALVA